MNDHWNDNPHLFEEEREGEEIFTNNQNEIHQPMEEENSANERNQFPLDLVSEEYNHS